jgi:thioredoxin reductase (NADPH)
LLSLLKEQAHAYGISLNHSRVTSLIRTKDGFVGWHKGGEVAARFVLLATGIVDANPKMKDLEQAIGQGSLRYCPVCDGFEATDRKLAVLGDGEDASSKARFLRTYSRDVTLLWQKKKPQAPAPMALDEEFAIEGPVDGLKLAGRGIHAMVGERVLNFDIVYPAMGCEVRSELASGLGAAMTDIGSLKVDAHQRTTVQGLYAAGDVVSDLHQIAVATGHAAIAATHIHKSSPRNFR